MSISPNNTHPGLYSPRLYSYPVNLHIVVIQNIIVLHVQRLAVAIGVESVRVFSTISHYRVMLVPLELKATKDKREMM